MTQNVYIKQELTRLIGENETLKRELGALRQYVAGLALMMDTVDSLNSQADVTPLLDDILSTAIGVTNAQDGSLLVRDDETNELVFVLTQGNVEPSHLIGQRIPAGQGIAGWVLQHRRPTVVNNTRSDIRFYGGIDQTFGYTTNTILACPIMGGGEVMGVVELLNKHSGGQFTEMDQTLLVIMCRFVGEILARTLQSGDMPVSQI